MSTLLKRRFVDQIKVMFGWEPSKPTEISPAAQKIHFYKKGNRDLIAEKLHARAHAVHDNKWRTRRWVTLILANLLFTFSFFLDIQVLEGALTASRFVGFHLIDLNSALQVMLAHKHIINNLIIGTGTVLVLWALLGGRTFCSWVCPYHLLAEWAEKIHLFLVKKKLVTDQTMDRRLRTVFWVIFALLAEERGFLGSLVVLSLYFIVIYRCIAIARTARDRLGVFLAMGMVALFACQVLINVGVVLGLMPTTGVPLPLMSYGGSSLISTMAGMGLVLNVWMRRLVN